MVWDALPEGTFDVIVADPPWSYYGQQGKWGAAAKFYPTVADAAVVSLPIEQLLRETGILFLWATSPRLDAAMECLKAWKLSFRGVAFVWVKSRKDGQPIGAQGVRPSIVKPTAEYVLAASRVSKGRPMKLHDESIPNVVLATRREHSRKPDAIQDHIERMYPQSAKLELFARTQRPGWTSWGNQTDQFSSLVSHE